MPEQSGGQPGGQSDGQSGGQSGGRQRLLASLRTPTRSQAVVGVLLALVGFAGVTQIRANEVDDSYAGLREQDLIDVLNGLAGTSQRTQAEIDRLTRTREDLQSVTSRRQAALDEAQVEADSLAVLAGLVPVSGPGIRVTITEETGTVQLSSMIDVLQELRTVGAEAMQINGEVRIVAQTSFEEAEGGLLVDGTLVESPYVVDAIGLPSSLAAAIRFPLGPRKQLLDDGARSDVEELNTLDIDTVRVPLEPDVAEFDPEQ